MRTADTSIPTGLSLLAPHCFFSRIARSVLKDGLGAWNCGQYSVICLSILQTSLCGERNRLCVSYTDGRNGRAGVATESEAMDLFRCVWAWVMGRAREPVPRKAPKSVAKAGDTAPG